MTVSRTAIAIAIATASLVSACGGTSENSAAQPRSMSEFQDALAAKSSLLERNRYDAISQCMASAGFEFRDESGVGIIADEAVVVDYYGYAHALQGALKFVQSSEGEPIAPESEIVPNEYNFALTGSDSGDGVGGCRAEANGLIAQDVLGPEIIARLEQSLQSFSSRPEVAKSIDQWAICMGEFYPTFTFTQPDQVEGYMDQAWAAVATQAGISQSGLSPADTLRTLPSTVSGPLIEEVLVIEEQLWNRDQACQESSGFGPLQDDLLSLVLSDLPKDFWDVSS